MFGNNRPTMIIIRSHDYSICYLNNKLLENEFTPQTQN